MSDATTTRRLRPVRPHDLVTMAVRMADAGRDRTEAVLLSGLDSPPHQRATARHERRCAALQRLADALERQGRSRS